MTVPASALWFPLDDAFREIEQTCIDALAADVVGQTLASELVPADRRPPTTLRIVDGRMASRVAEARARALDPVFREQHARGSDFVAVRDQLRTRLFTLREKLSQGLSEPDVFAVLVAIVVYTDELLASVGSSQRVRWQSLQSELFRIDNGGEYFYALLEERLTKQETHPLVFQVFYFCLENGFIGMLDGDLPRLKELTGRVAAKIPLAPPVVWERDKPPAPVEPMRVPWRYYVVAGAAVLALYAFFSLLGAIS